MNGNATLHPLKTSATRIARQLRAGGSAGTWVSTEAGVRTATGEVLRPAVLVATGEPPYDGIVADSVVLVVELDSQLAQRWRGARVGEVWAPCGGGAVCIRGAAARIVPAGDTLAADRDPSLTVPVALLCPAAAEGGTPD